MFEQQPVSIMCATVAPLIAILTITGGCAAHRGEIVVDYIFSVDGIVRDSAGDPLEGVEVTLELGQTVFEVITPVDKRVLVTDQSGRFAVFFIGHHSATPYTLSFAKPGYVRESVTGTSPPHREHSVTLQPKTPVEAKEPPGAHVLPNDELQRTRPAASDGASPLNSVLDGRHA
jgi:hypothetical protein